MTTETTAQPLPRRSDSGMHSRAINAAAGVLLAAKQQGKQFPIGVAIALDSAILLNSPEHAAEFERMRQQLAAVLAICDKADSHGITTGGPLTIEAVRAAATGRHPADDPIAYTLTDAANAIVDDAPARQLPALAVACPYCAAKPGDLCTSHSGTRPRRKDVHRHRTLAWKNAEADGITRRIAPTQALSEPGAAS
ncbi:zinc finger domain-containing protein [Streptomyces sp. YIM S03343]